jgi:hypothetical protein
MILVVGDLSRAALAGRPGKDLLEALVAQAEVRVARFDPPQDGRPWRRRNPR